MSIAVIYLVNIKPIKVVTITYLLLGLLIIYCIISSSSNLDQAIMSEEDLSLQLANLLKNGLNSQPQNPKLSDNLQINLKLNSRNYALWTRMIRVAIGGKSKALLSHVTSNPPEKNSETYEQWEQEDLIVFSWLIQNIEPTLAGNLTEYPTAKTLWDALVVTYNSGRDKLQTFNLHVKANDIKQNDSSLEEFWITLQGIWGEIDRIDPNPMKCPEDIKTYSKHTQNSEILRLEPLPSVEAAYATVRKEAAHRNILGATNHETQGIAGGLVATEIEGAGLVTKGHRRSEGRRNGPTNKEDKTHLKCDHCGMMKDTKEQCFRLVGYPDWWADGHKKGTKNLRSEKGKPPAVDNSTNRKNPTGFGGVAAAELHEGEGSFSMTTDTMTHDLTDFSTTTKPTKSHIHTANGDKMNVKNEGTIEISPTIKLSKCLYVPALSHKLFSVSHVTKELNCTVLMQPTFCILQDIKTGAIIGRGTERQGLYYVDEVAKNGTVMLSHGSTEREARLWHRRLGHPSTSYLHILFPKLFPSNCKSHC
ncbi:hypothetical protein OSB04_015869 [Centaurea solstitialis]|uniref:GAG-pre-integrase domain-containing protein n=1 Tax=Centaurea solstitialis TaxID=347529 RepID=A0AA38WJ61_9ASTR|nr:hypothetical protein OSB04_015869 [Centaurea solstitialis]